MLVNKVEGGLGFWGWMSVLPKAGDLSGCNKEGQFTFCLAGCLGTGGGRSITLMERRIVLYCEARTSAEVWLNVVSSYTRVRRACGANEMKHGCEDWGLGRWYKATSLMEPDTVGNNVAQLMHGSFRARLSRVLSYQDGAYSVNSLV